MKRRREEKRENQKSSTSAVTSKLKYAIHQYIRKNLICEFDGNYLKLTYFDGK